MPPAIELELNGKIRCFDDVSSLRDLIRVLEVREERIAVEINRKIIRREDWDDTPLCNRDRVEIVQFVGGG